MTKAASLRAWFVKNRTSVRAAFMMRVLGMGAGSLLSLIWTRLLLRAMGDSLWGLFSTFQATARLGGLGELGLTGAISVKGGLMLGRGEENALRRLLASARLLILLLAVFLFLAFLAVSPWLPGWLKWPQEPGAGSLPLLVVWAGITCAALILSGYFHSLAFAHGTVTWPILPTVFVGQFMAPFAQWQLARLGQPLWVQSIPYVLAAILLGWLARLMLKWSHPWLGELRPIAWDWAAWKSLVAASGWVYLCTIGSAIYSYTDRIVITIGFGPGVLPMYQANYKACELGVTLLLSATAVSLPKITRWIGSSDPADRQRLVMEANRLNLFQIVLGCGGALAYLALNDLFIRVWLGVKYQAPVLLQLAFACNLVVMAAGDAGVQISTRCGDKGLRQAGLVIALTGLLNLGLSLLATRMKFLTGVALATVVAQSVAVIILGCISARHLGISALAWIAKSWLLPLTSVLAAGVLKWKFAGVSGWNLGFLLGCYSALILFTARLAGMNLRMLREEFSVLRAMLGR